MLGGQNSWKRKLSFAGRGAHYLVIAPGNQFMQLPCCSQDVHAARGLQTVKNSRGDDESAIVFVEISEDCRGNRVSSSAGSICEAVA